MIKITECLDINLIEKLRSEYIEKPLDDNDNFSYHLLLTVNDMPLGCARFYRDKESSIIVDCIATDKSLDIRYREMLVRSMISRAMDITDGQIKVYDNVDLYTELGFVREENFFTARSHDIVFNCKCHK